MKRFFSIFRIKREERWLALFAGVVITTLNALVTHKYYDEFSVITDNYYKLFVGTFHISGYDPLTYSVVSNWSTAYNIYRHPLLAFIMYIPNQINQGLMALTGINCVQFVVALILVFCAFYAFVFLYRIFREVINLSQVDASQLSLMHLSFAYVMVASMVPDHFVISMYMLILTVYVCGKKMRRGLTEGTDGRQLFTRWQAILFFFLTAGISLNNGIKIFLAGLFTNGKKFFNPGRLLLTVIIPALAIWGFARWEYETFEYPNWKARQVKKQKKAQRYRERVYAQFRDTTNLTDEAQIKREVKKILHKKAIENERRKSKRPSVAHQGKPIKKGEFWNWTDITTSRKESAVENLFGESILLHQDWLLGDTLTGRPVIVKYRWIVNYIVEAIIVLFFFIGIWYGRRSRLLWMALSFFGFDMLIHMVAGFGINEIYIMSPHWLFVIPMAIAFFVNGIKGTNRKVLRLILGIITIYLFIYNGTLIVTYLT